MTPQSVPQPVMVCYAINGDQAFAIGLLTGVIVGLVVLLGLLIPGPARG